MTMQPSIITPDPQQHARRLTCLVLLLVGLTTALVPGQAQAQNKVGLFWDQAYTETDAVLPTLPGVITGYLVIKGGEPNGITGWEMCLDLQGPAQPVATTYNGQALNLMSAPCYLVGLATPSIPVAGDILLASIDFLITDTRPVTISLLPIPNASLPGYMSYVPADNPSALVILGTTTDTPEVATININNPSVELDPQFLDFGLHGTGTRTVQTVTVTNTGTGPITLAPTLNPGCEGFDLNDFTGGTSLNPGASMQVTIGFAPQAVQPYSCSLNLGTNLPTISLQGSGREPVFAYTVSSARYFGTVAIGAWQDASVIIQNTGEVPLSLTPELVGCGPEFSIIVGGEPALLPPGNLRVTNVRFQPLTADTLRCAFSFGAEFDEVPLQGIGREATFSYEVTGSLDFGVQVLEKERRLTVVVHNTGEAPVPVTAALNGCSPDLSIVAGGGDNLVLSGVNLLIQVSFLPTSTDPIACTLDLGEVVGSVPITAQGRLPIIDLLVPDLVDFGTVEVGSASQQYVTIRNQSVDAVTIRPALLDCDPAFSLDAPAEYFLTPGHSLQTLLHFSPTSPDSFSCSYTLGDSMPVIRIVGVATPAVPAWQIQPAFIDFPVTAPGDSRTQTLDIRNTGSVTLDLNVALPDSVSPFAIVAGGGARQLEPSGLWRVVVGFAPITLGSYATELSLGGLLPNVPVQGQSAIINEACTVSPSALDFGAVIVSTTHSQTVTVTNIGNVSLTLNPSATPSAFQIDLGQVTLAAGAAQQFQVRFNPVMSGTFAGTVSFGPAVCPTVTCAGEASYPPVTDGDQLGLFFDTDFNNNNIELPAFVASTGYLVLREPSDFSGIVGWECRLDLIGEGIFLSWDLGPGAVNFGVRPEFIVGLPEPLPWALDVVLARFDFLLLQESGVLLFTAGPVSAPSIPGQMAWINAEYAPQPMVSITGMPELATVNGGIPVAIAAPTPTATVSGGRVELSWPAPTAAGAVSRVYRRTADTMAERLTELPRVPGATEIRYTDQPSGFAPGTTLFYSYGVVSSDGLELARSPETEIELPGHLVTRTQLLPNVPNPFNPQTEIRFELERPAAVRVSIYDVTGRVVRVLQDGYLAAGPYTRVWGGRDNAGRAVSSGAYYVRLEFEGRMDHRKIMLLK